MKQRKCEVCSKLYTPHRKSQRYCSSKCFGQSIKHPGHECEYCGEHFEHTASSVNRFCSLKCANKAQRDPIEVTCETCGKAFEVNRYRYEHSNVRFCSRECKTQSGRAKLTCEVCGKTVDVHRHKVESDKYTGRFCSYECAAQWQRGENHSNWQGGYEKWRGPNWNDQRERAYERDNHTCQRCGITENELGRPLDVHHIVPWREFDHDWANANKLNNLVSLCPHCHTTIERNDNIPSPHSHTNQQRRNHNSGAGSRASGLG